MSDHRTIPGQQPYFYEDLVEVAVHDGNRWISFRLDDLEDDAKRSIAVASLSSNPGIDDIQLRAIKEARK